MRIQEVTEAQQEADASRGAISRKTSRSRASVSEVETAPVSIHIRTHAEVAIARDYLTYLPISTSYKREKGWEAERPGESNGKKWLMKMKAVETINYFDFNALLAVVIYAQNHPNKIVNNPIAGKPHIEIQVPKMYLYEIMENRHPEVFFGKGKLENGEALETHGYFSRLKSWTITVFGETEECLETWRPLMDYNPKLDLYVLNKSFYDKCIENTSAKIHFRQFLSIESQVAKAMYLYLSSRVKRIGKGIEVATIARVMGKSYNDCNEQSDTRKLFASALCLLIKMGILKGEDNGKKASYIAKESKKDVMGNIRKPFVLHAAIDVNFYSPRSTLPALSDDHGTDVAG